MWIPPQTDEQRERSARLQRMVKAACEVFDAMSPEEKREARRQQLYSFVRGEAGLGSDVDEAAYASALRAGDQAAFARLKAESEARVARVDEMIASGDL